MEIQLTMWQFILLKRLLGLGMNCRGIRMSGGFASYQVSEEKATITMSKDGKTVDLIFVAGDL